MHIRGDERIPICHVDDDQMIPNIHILAITKSLSEQLLFGEIWVFWDKDNLLELLSCWQREVSVIHKVTHMGKERQTQMDMSNGKLHKHS